LPSDGSCREAVTRRSQTRYFGLALSPSLYARLCTGRVPLSAPKIPDPNGLALAVFFFCWWWVFFWGGGWWCFWFFLFFVVLFVFSGF